MKLGFDRCISIHRLPSPHPRRTKLLLLLPECRQEPFKQANEDASCLCGNGVFLSKRLQSTGCGECVSCCLRVRFQLWTSVLSLYPSLLLLLKASNLGLRSLIILRLHGFRIQSRLYTKILANLKIMIPDAGTQPSGLRGGWSHWPGKWRSLGGDKCCGEARASR